MKLILTKNLNSYFINNKQVNYKEFYKIFDDLKYKQISFINYIENGQLVNKWVLNK